MRLIGLALTFVLALSLAAAAQLALALPASAQIPDFPPPKPIVDVCKVLIGGDFWTERSCRDYIDRILDAPDHLGWSITGDDKCPRGDYTKMLRGPDRTIILSCDQSPRQGLGLRLP